jgi:hypothetical protein
MNINNYNKFMAAVSTTDLDQWTKFHNEPQVILMAILMNIPDEQVPALTKQVKNTILTQRKKQTGYK